ncbi:MAG: hypothetical protein GVY07_03380 [Bacteroidetes bacterium]|jgi:hypothetical protein|nr:hypothetical protein [Bacteroidota bacterium]
MKALKIVTVVSFLFMASIAIANDISTGQAVAEDSTAVANVENEKALFSKLEKGLVKNLNSRISGVVESSMYNAVNYKVEYPEFSSDRVEAILNRIAVEGESHSLRYKAYLTLAYYKNQDQFDSPETLLSMLNYKHQDGIFFYLQEKVQSDQFTSKIN